MELPKIERPLNEWETHHVHPEWYVAISEIPNTLGFVVGGILLFYVTKADLATDPMYHIYKTFHQCYLIDYLPGQLFAMPLFAAGTLLW